MQRPKSVAPSVVNPAFLIDGRLIAEDFAAQIKANLAGSENGVYTPDQFPNNKFTTIKNGNQYFAVYDKPMGKGQFGEVLAAQNIDTGEWIALKHLEIGKNLAAFDAQMQNAVAEVKRLEEQQRSPAEDKTLAFLKDRLEQGKVYKQQMIDDLARQRADAKNEDDILKIMDQSKGSSLIKETPKAGYAVQDYYLFMELAPGLSITEHLKNAEEGLNYDPSQLSDNEKEMITLQLAEKFAQTLERGVILTDIHLNNVMFDKNSGQVKLIDVGDALIYDVNHTPEVKGEICGSPPFVSPEVLKAMASGASDCHYNEKTMIYSLGAMLSRLYDLASVEDSFKVQHVEDRDKFKIMVIREEQIPDQPEQVKLKELLGRMLDKNPDNRPSLQEVKESLAFVYSKQKEYDDVQQLPNQKEEQSLVKEFKELEKAVENRLNVLESRRSKEGTLKKPDEQKFEIATLLKTAINEFLEEKNIAKLNEALDKTEKLDKTRSKGSGKHQTSELVAELRSLADQQEKLIIKSVESADNKLTRPLQPYFEKGASEQKRQEMDVVTRPRSGQF